MAQLINIYGKNYPKGTYLMLRTDSTKYIGILESKGQYGWETCVALNDCYSSSSKNFTYTDKKYIVQRLINGIHIISPAKYMALKQLKQRYDSITGLIKDTVNGMKTT